jgi:hypothetical protein
MPDRLIFLFSTIAMAGAIFPIIAAPTRQRDLTGYDKAVADYTNSSQPFVVTRDLQDFVWIHWKQHRRAYVVVRSLTAEGKEMVNMTKRLFIEPGKDGSWCVHGEVQSEVAPLRWMPASQRKTPQAVTRQFEAVSIEKAGGDQHLVLKDKSGNVVDTIANATAYFQ